MRKQIKDEGETGENETTEAGRGEESRWQSETCEEEVGVWFTAGCCSL